MRKEIFEFFLGFVPIYFIISLVKYAVIYDFFNPLYAAIILIISLTFLIYILYLIFRKKFPIVLGCILSFFAAEYSDANLTFIDNTRLVVLKRMDSKFAENEIVEWNGNGFFLNDIYHYLVYLGEDGSKSVREVIANSDRKYIISGKCSYSERRINRQYAVVLNAC